MIVVKNRPMETFEITGDWGTQSKLIRKIYPTITISDLYFERGKENEMLHQIEKRLNQNRSTVIDMIKEIFPNDEF
jgi:hypothetical protein